MRRLASGFATLWTFIFVPSLIVWVLLARAFDRGIGVFRACWHWVEDMLVFPLVLSPMTNGAWYLVEEGTPLGVTLGFLSLVAIWALMLALPPVLILSWWRWAAQRLSKSAAPSPTPYSMALPGGSHSGTGSSRPTPSPGPSPLAPLYLVTVPLALVWVGIGKVRSWLHGSFSLFVCLGLFSLTFIVITGFFAFMFGKSPYWERYDILDFVANTMWYGYLDTIRVPYLFQDEWRQAFRTVALNSDRLDSWEWPEYMGSWYRHDEFRTIVWTTATRHGLAVVVGYLLYSLMRRILK